jgi:hypothetical protein
MGMTVTIDLAVASAPASDVGSEIREALGMRSTPAPGDVPGPITITGIIDSRETTPEQFVEQFIESRLDENSPDWRTRLTRTVGVSRRPTDTL